MQELAIDYTHCQSAGDTFVPIPDSAVDSSFHSSNTTSRPQWKSVNRTVEPLYGVEQENTPVCTIQFTLPNAIGPPVYLYYRLTNFYQNHRRYVKSLDLDQLKGQAVDVDTMEQSSCSPLSLAPNGKPYYPCGLIANSIFNDTIKSPTLVSSPGGQTSENISFTDNGIAWNTDMQLYGETAYTNDEVVPPPNWQKRFPNGYTDENPIPNLNEYEQLAVWLRTAGLPTFSKLALRNTEDVMEAGTYQIEIYDCRFCHAW